MSCAIAWGDCPVQRLNARQKAAGSAKPVLLGHFLNTQVLVVEQLHGKVLSQGFLDHPDRCTFILKTATQGSGGYQQMSADILKIGHAVQIVPLQQDLYAGLQTAVTHRSTQYHRGAVLQERVQLTCISDDRQL